MRAQVGRKGFAQSRGRSRGVCLEIGKKGFVLELTDVLGMVIIAALLIFFLAVTGIGSYASKAAIISRSYEGTEHRDVARNIMQVNTVGTESKPMYGLVRLAAHGDDAAQKEILGIYELAYGEGSVVVTIRPCHAEEPVVLAPAAGIAEEKGEPTGEAFAYDESCPGVISVSAEVFG